MNKFKWIVVVGLPKLAYWKDKSVNYESYFDHNIGSQVSESVRNTRQEARILAKKCSSENPWWNFSAKKETA